MKLIHLSDLHLGKRFNDFSMLEDQRYILHEILTIVDAEQPEAVLIAGDVYDKSVPSAEAVELFDSFLTSLSRRSLQVFVLSGNHDSPERLAFGGRLMESSGVHMAPVYGGALQPITLQDRFGKVNFYLLPFLKPSHVRAFFPEESIESYTDAVRTALRGLPLQPTERNVLLTHQFVTGAERCESEEISIGGSDNVDASAFEDFDYVALGHIHSPQNIGSPHIRYCGTPLKYSFSELSHSKSVTVAELGEKGELAVRTVPLKPLHELREIRGRYDELTLRSFYTDTDLPESYLRVILTDENDVPEAVGKLRTVYPYLMKLEYDNARTRHTADFSEAADVSSKSPLELFADFFTEQNGTPMSEQQESYIRTLIEKIWEEEV